MMEGQIWLLMRVWGMCLRRFKMKNIYDKDYKTISPTAIVTSYPRIFTDIPYEK